MVKGIEDWVLSCGDMRKRVHLQIGAQVIPPRTAPGGNGSDLAIRANCELLKMGAEISHDFQSAEDA